VIPVIIPVKLVMLEVLVDVQAVGVQSELLQDSIRKRMPLIKMDNVYLIAQLAQQKDPLLVFATRKDVERPIIMLNGREMMDIVRDANKIVLFVEMKPASHCVKNASRLLFS